ncbi:MAG: ester cyclase [Pseudomonadota bacterium]
MLASPIYPGFDPKWRSVPGYILGITEEIWEGRQIDSLTDYYAKDIIVRSPASVVVGNQGIQAATMATLAEFPDRTLLGEDVIWCETQGTDDGPVGFLSSHRLTSTATHTGTGAYGAPSGKKLSYRILADCWCQRNQVRDEWLVRDQGAIVRQVGADPKSWAADLIVAEGGPERCVQPLSPDSDVEGPYFGRGNHAGPGAELASALKEMMSGAFSVIHDRYDRACELAYAGGITGMGHNLADQFWLGLRSSFPSAAFRIEHSVGMEEPGHPPRAAVRWSLYGKHDGHGQFGPATGCYVYVMGITHAEFGPRGLRREWTLIDETAIWKQILLATG